MADLIRAARDVLAEGPGLRPEVLLRERYLAACLVEDALDFDGADTADARQILALTCGRAREVRLHRNESAPPKAEGTIGAADRFRTGLGTASVQSVARSAGRGDWVLRQASERALGVSGFFEWEFPARFTQRPPRRG